MNTSKFFCHTCEKNIVNATQQPTGEYRCEVCNDPYVEILSDKEEETLEEEMVIEDYDPDIEQAMELEEVMDMEPDVQPESHTTFNFHFNVNINGQNVFSSSSSGRSPQPYSFVGGNIPGRTEVPRAESRRRQPQPYSHVFVDPPRPQRQSEPFTGPFMPGFSFPPTGMMFGFMDMGFGPQERQGRFGGFPSHPLFDQFFGQAPMAGGANPRDYFQGNMNDLLAQMHRQHEAENGKPPAAKSVIDMLPTTCLTKVPDDEGVCAVCQDKYCVGDTVCKLPCGHEYHKDCVVPWLERHCTCPVCRHEVGKMQEPETASQAA